MTPTTAAVIPVKGAVNLTSCLVASTVGPPSKINRKDGRKVKSVATPAPAAPAKISISGQNISFVQAPTKPTNATTIINGPGVVSPNASPSIIWAPLNHA